MQRQHGTAAKCITCSLQVTNPSAKQLSLAPFSTVNHLSKDNYWFRQENYVQAREKSFCGSQQSLKSAVRIKGWHKYQERAEKWVYLAHYNSTLSGPYLHLTSSLLTINDDGTFFPLQNASLSKQNLCCNTLILAKFLQDTSYRKAIPSQMEKGGETLQNSWAPRSESAHFGREQSGSVD